VKKSAIIDRALGDVDWIDIELHNKVSPLEIEERNRRIYWDERDHYFESDTVFLLGLMGFLLCILQGFGAYYLLGRVCSVPLGCDHLANGFIVLFEMCMVLVASACFATLPRALPLVYYLVHFFLVINREPDYHHYQLEKEIAVLDRQLVALRGD
jgi:uncharacterized membrane protein